MAISSGADTPGPVTADDVDRVVADAVLALAARTVRDWRIPAGDLEWDCWETVEHVADDLFAYAAQLTAQRPPLTRYLPIDARERHPGGPYSTIFVDPEAGPEGLLSVLDACGGLLSSAVRTASPKVRAYHPSGVSDPEGFAAMGVVEVVVHVNDLATALDFRWAPDDELCDRVLHRLFPHVPPEPAGWTGLLWAAGRTELPDRPRLQTWRWYAEPR